MISPSSIRTLFVFSPSSAPTTFITKIICIVLLLSLSNAAIIQPSEPSDDTPTTTLQAKVIDNVNNNNVAILEKYSRQSTNQRAMARKFDDIDLIPSLARTFMKPLKVYMNPVMRRFVKAYSTYQWFEPELEFGSCMIEQRYNVNPTEMARSTMLNIIQTLFNKLREMFNMVSFEMKEEKAPQIDYTYYEQYPSLDRLVVQAGQTAVEHQINTQIPTRPPPIKFIPPRLRPSIGGPMVSDFRRRQGRGFDIERRREDKKQELDENYDKVNIFNNPEISELPQYKRVKRYRRQTNQRKMAVKMPVMPVKTPHRRQYFYPKPVTSPGGVNAAFLNQAMVSPSYSHVNSGPSESYGPPNPGPPPSYSSINPGLPSKYGPPSYSPVNPGPPPPSYSPINPGPSSNYGPPPSYSSINPGLPSKYGPPSYSNVNSGPPSGPPSSYGPPGYPIVNSGPPPSYSQGLSGPSQYVPTPYTQQFQQNPQQFTYQDFHLPEDQPVDDYKGMLDQSTLIDTRPISVDLQSTYTNWVDDFENIILDKLGLQGKANNPKTTGMVACAQGYTWTLMMRFAETMMSKMFF